MLEQWEQGVLAKVLQKFVTIFYGHLPLPTGMSIILLFVLLFSIILLSGFSGLHSLVFFLVFSNLTQKLVYFLLEVSFQYFFTLLFLRINFLVTHIIK